MLAPVDIVFGSLYVKYMHRSVLRAHLAHADFNDAVFGGDIHSKKETIDNKPTSKILKN